MMRVWRGCAALAVLAAFAMVSTGALAQDKEASDEMTGIKIGEKAPDFTLTNVDGTEKKLSDLVKQGTVALVFFRSANW